MYGLQAESFRQTAMQLLPGKLLPPSLHASGLHDREPRGIRPFETVFFSKIQQGEGHTEQQGPMPSLPQLCKSAEKTVMVIEVVAALGPSAFLYKTVRHIDQRRTLPLQIGRQQGQNDIILRLTVELPESAQKTLLVIRFAVELPESAQKTLLVKRYVQYAVP